ncbi:hypothetical protein Hanom_Chr03g00261651 [Helianthus anomalus]
MKNPYMPHTNLFTNKMYIDLNMFGSLMLNRIIREINGRDVVTIDHRGNGVWEGGLVECNVTRNMNLTRSGIEATVSTKIRWVTKEDATNGPGMKFVGLSGRRVWVTGTPEHS